MTVPNPDPRERALPKWAQRVLEDLRLRLASAERAAEEARLLTDPEGSDVVVRVGLGKPVGLGRRSRIAFKLPKTHPDWTREIHAQQDGNGRINVRVVGAGRLDVRPVAANVITIGAGEE